MGPAGASISLFNMLLFSFVGKIPPIERLNPSAAEVAAVFTVPIERLLRLEPEIHYVHLTASPGKNFPYHKIPGGRDYPWHTGVVEEVFYEVDGHIIWGLTARVLQYFLALVRKSQL